MIRKPEKSVQSIHRAGRIRFYETGVQAVRRQGAERTDFMPGSSMKSRQSLLFTARRSLYETESALSAQMGDTFGGVLPGKSVCLFLKNSIKGKDLIENPQRKRRTGHPVRRFSIFCGSQAFLNAKCMKKSRPDFHQSGLVETRGIEPLTS